MVRYSVEILAAICSGVSACRTSYSILDEILEPVIYLGAETDRPLLAASDLIARRSHHVGELE